MPAPWEDWSQDNQRPVTPDAARQDTQSVGDDTNDRSATAEVYDKTTGNGQAKHAPNTNVCPPESAANRNSATALVRTVPVPSHDPSSTSSRDGLERGLFEIHIFMIAIGAVIGLGFYVRTGAVYNLGGSAAVIYSFGVLGLVTSLVMHNLAKMLRAWPVPGALIVFVQKFVDEEIGLTIGILYWLAYIFAFAGLATALGGLLDSVLLNAEGERITTASVLISIVSLILPILFNLTPIWIFRTIEVGFGIFKLALAVFFIVLMNVLNPRVGTFQQSPLPRTNSLLHESLSNAVVRKDVAFIDNGKYGGWFGVLMASIYVTAFGFVGVEAVAATSREAGPKTTERKNHDNPSSQDDNNYEMGRNGTRLDRLRFSSSPNDEANTAEQAEHTTQASRGPANPLQRDQRRQTPGAGDVFRLPAILVPIVAAFIYIWASWSVTQNIDFRDSSLPSLEWAQPNGTSIFIAATDKDNNPGLSKALTALLIVQLFSTSSTALYIASRTLYGIAYIVLRKRGPTGPWPVQIAWRLTRTTKQGVPWVSVLISAWLFWLPFTRYASGSSANIAIGVITEMGSVSCILVWAFESLAAFRLYGAYRKHYSVLTKSGVNRHWVIKANRKGWYYLHRATSLSAVMFCLFIVFVGGAMTCKNNDQSPLQGIAAFLIIGIFIVIIISLKVMNKTLAGIFTENAVFTHIGELQLVEILKYLDELNNHV